MKYLTEAGIMYRHGIPDEPAYPGETRYRVRWLHIPSGVSGERTLFTFWTRGQNGGAILANYWNRSQAWKYVVE